jgi:O-succinylbenzoate synthase
MFTLIANLDDTTGLVCVFGSSLESSTSLLGLGREAVKDDPEYFQDILM